MTETCQEYSFSFLPVVSRLIVDNKQTNKQNKITNRNRKTEKQIFSNYIYKISLSYKQKATDDMQLI